MTAQACRAWRGATATVAPCVAWTAAAHGAPVGPPSTRPCRTLRRWLGGTANASRLPRNPRPGRWGEVACRRPPVGVHAARTGDAAVSLGWTLCASPRRPGVGASRPRPGRRAPPPCVARLGVAAVGWRVLCAPLWPLSVAWAPCGPRRRQPPPRTPAVPHSQHPAAHRSALHT